MDEVEAVQIKCMVNGHPVTANVEPRMLLVDFLRHELRLTGTHVGCEIGVCGACTVIVDDDAIRSCLMFAVQVDGRVVRTVEGLAKGAELTPMQMAFSRCHGLQCGFCTPGILMTLTAAGEQGIWPSDAHEARELLSGNLCRCTGYQGMIDAILELSR
ncbi:MULTISPECIES: (2Fe-2S)-binding protein [Bradyrhizobium]|uniref:(2Fe-2S)-binding protein n=1 Tax=Bradyrhizobium TaxID=374 RepID=UPI00144945BD|nr:MULTISPECIES: (2Fe-2S)-binding protein [Bradyrhizobium]MCP1924706.1 aerobic-type carbon monoxide dehydrogenase small subunit (CoxS/CutS family) [Bradyrhizobium elkanii]MCS3584534.1 aerobic-type carbon monoxide dehydrogenase small subunit (CoxS/CutS family) [Bradyrhizobium elkanii]MCS3718114.1 aerobic-type carbon monoxide dehydrogenase small subunit (CoxS/CutS family) [Bradyrhizobium elkanii]MCS4011822.1 aerobic-type carbon monoxide dehydrogenase small subunit (CoxS/CutS family) [Bradyrhizobi